MMRLIIPIFFFSSLFPLCRLYAQQEKPEMIAYKSAVSHANKLFKQGKYFEAIVYYKEAQALKPDENLPKYRIEDIKTIYIKKEVEKILDNNDEPESKRKNKKEIEAEMHNRALLEQDIRRIVEAEIIEMDKKEVRDSARQKIQDMEIAELLKRADKERKKEIEDSIARAKRIEETRIKVAEEEKKMLAESAIKNEVIEIPLHSDMEVEQIKNSKTEPDQISIEGQDKESLLVLTEIPKDTIKIAIEEKNQINEKEQEKESSLNSGNSQNAENTGRTASYAKAKEERQKQLREQYPDERTVEVMKSEGKIITKIIINRNNEVTVFLKVEHNWGGTFYFIDYSPEPLVSISKDYFERRTK
ncbi:MAG: hypothetical protein HY738_05880 [Bacteroidia bacterium]|nr:hypothetical protein [Bacteroidia bacterium]